MPIGRPLGARRMYILDGAFNPAVQGGSGELLIGGALLALELGEIEARLQEHAQVREALVIDIDGPSGKQLAAYLVPNDPALALADAAGKLDRKALPKPDPSLWQQDYVAPRNEREQQLAAIWAEVLQVERVGLHDNFFELGGHSLLAAQVISRIHSSLGIDIPLRLIFEKPQLNEFSQAFEDAGLALTADGLSDIERMMNEMAEA